MKKITRNHGLAAWVSTVVIICSAMTLQYSALSQGAEETQPLTAGPRYIGEAKCKICHKAIDASWRQTDHAHAFAKLDPAKGETNKPECVKCHVTGFGAGGFEIGKETPDLKNIQCEACHGAGSNYRTIPVMKDRTKAIAAGLIHPIEETLCTKCHNSESPAFKGFDFATAVQKVMHLDTKHDVTTEEAKTETK